MIGTVLSMMTRKYGLSKEEMLVRCGYICVDVGDNIK